MSGVPNHIVAPSLKFDCPKCLRPHTVEEIEATVETKQAQSLDAFVHDVGEWQEVQEFVGLTLRPCGHEFRFTDWVLITDEGGTRLHRRETVHLTDEDGRAIPL